MPRLLSRTIPVLLTVLYFWFVSRPIETGQGSLPPLATFFNPFTGFWQNAESDSFSEDLSDGANVSSAVRIVYNERLVPHVYADNEDDVAFGQGYLHAKYRLWQMDITARQAAGRLAEVFGEGLLENDRRMRRMGMPWAAAKHANAWRQCPDFSQVESYVAGVNFYIQNLKPGDYPLEFKLFDYEPELWSAYHTALILMAMNLNLCGRNQDIAATNTRAALGDDMYQFLFPRWNPRQSPIIPAGTIWNVDSISPGTALPYDQPVHHHFEQFSDPGTGSNNWAVNGELTASGYPILCNDPHLSLSLPSTWYEIQLATPEYCCYGVTLPGVPNIIIGFNQDIAWGVTNVGMDVSDFYQIDWIDTRGTTYNLDGQPIEVEVQEELYHVKHESPVSDTLKFTHWGPVYLDDSIVLALRWLPHIAYNTCLNSTFLGLNQARDYGDFLGAIQHFSNPPQNFAFASRTGDIALKVQGFLPVKPTFEGEFIMKGDQTARDWEGMIPFLQTPMIKNPERGFVSSANQHSTDTTYPYRYHGYYDDFRGRTLNLALEQMKDITVDDMKELQLSTYNLLAAEFCPVLAGLVEKYVDDKWLKRLKDWDFKYGPEDLQPIFFEHWFRTFRDLTWDELDVLAGDLDMLRPEDWHLVDMVIASPEHEIFDNKRTSVTEDARSLAAESYRKTTQYVDSLLAMNPALDWSAYKQVRINHLSRIPSFSKVEINTGGVSEALNSIKRTHGPSWRMVVEAGPSMQAWGIYPGGQSGNPGSHFYDHMVDDWADGQYYDLVLTPDPADLESRIIYSEFLRP